MDTRSRAHDVKNALQRAKHKISSLENELSVKEGCSESEEELHPLAWAHKQELKDSLVDMYKANPKVNEELKQRLPSPVKIHCSETTPQLGFIPVVSVSDTSPSQSSVSEALDKEFPPAPRPARRGEEPAPGSLPPPPARAADTVGTMEEERPSVPGPVAPEAQRSPRHGQGQDGDELDTCSPPPAPPRCVPEDQGNAKVSSYGDSRRQVPVLDREKNIAFLLKELDSLRDLNKKLQDRLALKERELETRLLDTQLQEAELEARACERAAVLVEEIYRAQRDRDQAVMARLRLANEERDEALLRAQKLQQAALELDINPEESDADLEELLNRVNSADSALGVECSGAAIVERLQQARERRAKITTEEMKAVIEERDTALARCKRLEQELLRVREQSQTLANNARHLTAENNQGRARKVQEELAASQRGRDQAVERCQKLEEEIQTLRRYFSAHQALPEEASRKEQSGSISQGKEGPAASPQTQPQPQPQPQAQALLARLQLLASEHHSTQAQFQLSQEAEREANEKVQKLERLVEVLRKKVGTGSVRTVI